jgi:hypothetical protein
MKTKTITLPNGETAELFDTDYLAHAMGRTYNTIRQWEIGGLLPPTPFRGKQVYERFYTQEQINVVVTLAEKYQLFIGRKITQTMFPKRCFKEFAKLEKKYLGEKSNEIIKKT